MRASLDKAQLLSGVGVRGGERDSFRTEGPWALLSLELQVFLGVGNLNLTCPCRASNMAITNHNRSVLAVGALLHLPHVSFPSKAV